MLMSVNYSELASATDVLQWLTLGMVVATVVSAVWTLWRQRQSFVEIGERAEPASFVDQLKQLLTMDDVSLRVIVEVFHAGGTGRYLLATQTDERRAYALQRIQRALRTVLSDSLTSPDFVTIRERVLRLLDESQADIERLRQRRPFDDLQEPERSLLLDVIAEIPADKPVPRQKVFQLADIIKIKHQDMLELQAKNARSAIWSKWGAYGTVLFGVLSVLLSVRASMK